MKLHTEIPIQKQDDSIDYASKILLLGSCFAENMAEKFEYFKFQNLLNPLGILFHPKAIENLISRAVQAKFYTEADVFFYNERWHCYDAHSKFSNTNAEALIEDLNIALNETRAFISNASHIFITLGTAWVYEHVKSGDTVANCHKVPQKQFHKKLLSISEISTSLEQMHRAINQLNNTVKIIFTVSPIRHLKDGLIENSRSKAQLIAAVHNFTASGVCYFPSFEIMLDELRDYRFYKSDMLHPNATAIEYIWKRLEQAWIETGAKELMAEVAAIQRDLAHKPFNARSESHQKFLSLLIRKQELLKVQIPHLRF